MILNDALKNTGMSSLSATAMYNLIVPVSIFDDTKDNKSNGKKITNLKDDFVKWNIDKDFIYAVVSGIL